MQMLVDLLSKCTMEDSREFIEWKEKSKYNGTYGGPKRTKDITEKSNIAAIQLHKNNLWGRLKKTLAK